jgi:hypothetical protein
MALGTLPSVERAPMFSDGPRDFTGRKQTQRAIRTETRILKDTAAGIRVSTTVAAGQVRTLRSGSPDPLRAEGVRDKVKGERAEGSRVDTSSIPAAATRDIAVTIPTSRRSLEELEAEFANELGF